jgi:hypothetical protein
MIHPRYEISSSASNVFEVDTILEMSSEGGCISLDIKLSGPVITWFDVHFVSKITRAANESKSNDDIRLPAGTVVGVAWWYSPQVLATEMGQSQLIPYWK